MPFTAGSVSKQILKSFCSFSAECRRWQPTTMMRTQKTTTWTLLCKLSQHRCHSNRLHHPCLQLYRCHSQQLLHPCLPQHSCPSNCLHHHLCLQLHHCHSNQLHPCLPQDSCHSNRPHNNNNNSLNSNNRLQDNSPECPQFWWR